MAKIIKWGLLAVVAIAVLIKLSLWLSVRSIMNDAIAQLSPIMDISYGGITSSFDGRVGLEKLSIRVPALGDSVRVEHAQLKFNGLGELLRFKESLAEGKFPEQLAINLKGLALDVHGPFMQQLYDAPAERSLFTAMSEVSCGKVRFIGTTELLDMGYRTFVTDAEVAYLFSPVNKTLRFTMASDTQEMGELKVSLALANFSQNPGDMRAHPPELSQVTVEINDNQYQRKVQEYCAGKLGQTSEAYLKIAVEQFDKVLRSQRIALDPVVLEAYGRYLKDPQSLRLELNPNEGLAWSGLQFYEPKDALGMLHPSLLINNEVVTPLGFAWFDPNALKEQLANDKVVAERVESNAQTPQYDFVDVASLPKYAGKRLQFITHDGTYYQGVLHKVENGKAYLSVQFGSGSAEMFLRLDKIDKVRVLF